MIDWSCPDCGYRVELPETYAGTRVRCPQCGTESAVGTTSRPSGAAGGVGPLPEVAAPAAPAAPAAGAFEDAQLARCPFCRELIRADARKCKHCGEIIDSELRRQQRRAAAADREREVRRREGNKDAKNALICGIIGLFCFGVILGPVAIILGRKGLEYSRNYPDVGGSGQATAGIVLGIIDVVGFVINILVYAALSS